MDQSEEAKATATILARTFESVCNRLRSEKGLTEEQVGLACLATAVNVLAKAWTGEQLVKHLSGIMVALMDVYGIDPETGEAGRKATRN